LATAFYSSGAGASFTASLVASDFGFSLLSHSRKIIGRIQIFILCRWQPLSGLIQNPMHLLEPGSVRLTPATLPYDTANIISSI
jgi:hypothetical protein